MPSWKIGKVRVRRCLLVLLQLWKVWICRYFLVSASLCCPRTSYLLQNITWEGNRTSLISPPSICCWRYQILWQGQKKLQMLVDCDYIASATLFWFWSFHLEILHQVLIQIVISPHVFWLFWRILCTGCYWIFWSNIHQCESSRLVGITEISALGNRYELAFVLFSEVSFFQRVRVDKFHQGKYFLFI